MNSSNTQDERTIVQNRRSAQENLYSPKAVAKAIGVSESSLKRWCDSGKIAAMKTAGGHRRLRRSQVVSFLRERNKYRLLDPQSIGLPDLSGVSAADLNEAANQLHQGLLAEDEAKCIGLLTFLYVNGWAVAEIIDQVISVAFKQIGTLCQHGNLEIYQERRACEIVLAGMAALRSVVNPPLPGSLSAIGGTIEYDHYSVCAKSIELALASHGWQATSLGSNLPYSTLIRAALTKRPNLMWLSVSFLKDEAAFVRDLNSMAEQIPKSTTVVVACSAIKPWFHSKLQNVIRCDTITQLVELSEGIERIVNSLGSPQF